MNTRGQETRLELNVPLFNAFARAYNAAESLDKAAAEVYSITFAGFAAFMQHDKLAFDARASAVALAGIMTKEAVHYSYLSRPRVAVALSRLQRATAAAEDAARRAGKKAAPATEYLHDVTAAQILDTVELAWDAINILDATRENSATARAQLMAFQRLLTLYFTFGYNSPYIPGELAESLVASMKRTHAAIKALHKEAQKALRRVQNAR